MRSKRSVNSFKVLNVDRCTDAAMCNLCIATLTCSNMLALNVACFVVALSIIIGIASTESVDSLPQMLRRAMRADSARFSAVDIAVFEAISSSFRI